MSRHIFCTQLKARSVLCHERLRMSRQENFDVQVYLCRDKEKYFVIDNFLQNQSLEKFWLRHREIMSRPSSFIPLDICFTT